MRPPLVAEDLLREIAATHGTPCHVYELSSLRRAVAALADFDLVRYAQKANGNLTILRTLRELGVAVDAVSEGEIARALAAGFRPDEIVFTADAFSRRALRAVVDRDLRVNVGSEDMIEQYAAAGGRRPLTLRVNPGFGHGHDARVDTGGPDSKHGIWHEGLGEALARVSAAGLRAEGLHVHIGSGTDLRHLARVAGAVGELAPAFGDALRVVSAGGGLPIPYREGEPELDVPAFAGLWRETRRRLAERLGRGLRLEVEPGRFLVARCGILLTEVRAVKRVAGRRFAVLDAGFNDLLRPAMYGAYHEIGVLGPARGAPEPTLVAGPLCESGDLFTQGPGGRPEPRSLPPLRPGDLVVIHDTGAYGASMASGYNGSTLAPEVLVEGEAARLLRRRQLPEEPFELEEGRP